MPTTLETLEYNNFKPFINSEEQQVIKPGIDLADTKVELVDSQHLADNNGMNNHRRLAANAAEKLGQYSQLIQKQNNDVKSYVNKLIEGHDKARASLFEPKNHDVDQQPAQELNSPLENNTELDVYRHAAFSTLSEATATDLFEPPQDFFALKDEIINPLLLEPFSFDDLNNLSFSKVWDKIKEIIESVQESYVKVYETAMERYSAIFKEFSGFMSGLDATKMKVETDDKGVSTITLNKSLVAELTVIIDKYTSAPDGIIYSSPVGGDITADQARNDAINWAKELGLTDKSVTLLNGSYVVWADVSALKKIKTDLEAAVDKPMSTFVYQSWRTGFDSQADLLKTTLQTISTKYTNANALFDNLLQLLRQQMTEQNNALNKIGDNIS